MSLKEKGKLWDISNKVANLDVQLNKLRKQSKPKNLKTSEIVEMMDVERDGGFRRRAVTEIGCRRQTQCGCNPQDAEREQIRRHADGKGQGEARAVPASKRQCSPQSMRDDIHAPPLLVRLPTLPYIGSRDDEATRVSLQCQKMAPESERSITRSWLYLRRRGATN